MTHTVPTGSPPIRNDASSPSRMPGSAWRRAGNARSGCSTSRTASRAMTSPQGLSARGHRAVAIGRPGARRRDPAEAALLPVRFEKADAGGVRPRQLCRHLHEPLQHRRGTAAHCFGKKVQRPILSREIGRAGRTAIQFLHDQDVFDVAGRVSPAHLAIVRLSSRASLLRSATHGKASVYPRAAAEWSASPLTAT